MPEMVRRACEPSARLCRSSESTRREDPQLQADLFALLLPLVDSHNTECVAIPSSPRHVLFHSLTLPCTCRRSVFFGDQGRRAQTSMTLFYNCTKCVARVYRLCSLAATVQGRNSCIG